MASATNDLTRHGRVLSATAAVAGLAFGVSAPVFTAGLLTTGFNLPGVVMIAASAAASLSWGVARNRSAVALSATSGVGIDQVREEISRRYAPLFLTFAGGGLIAATIAIIVFVTVRPVPVDGPFGDHVAGWPFDPSVAHLIVCAIGVAFATWQWQMVRYGHAFFNVHVAVAASAWFVLLAVVGDEFAAWFFAAFDHLTRSVATVLINLT